MNSGLLPQNKTPFGSNLLVKFLFFAQKCMPPGIFIGNGGYHFEILQQYFTVVHARLRHVPITCHHHRIWVVVEVESAISAPFDSTWLAHEVARQWEAGDELRRGKVGKERERLQRRERERRSRRRRRRRKKRDKRRGREEGRMVMMRLSRVYSQDRMPKGR